MSACPGQGSLVGGLQLLRLCLGHTVEEVQIQPALTVAPLRADYPDLVLGFIDPVVHRNREQRLEVLVGEVVQTHVAEGSNVGKINMFGLSVRQINAEVLAQVIALGVLIADVLAGDNHLLSLLRLGLEPEAADPMVQGHHIVGMLRLEVVVASKHVAQVVLVSPGGQELLVAVGIQHEVSKLVRDVEDVAVIRAGHDRAGLDQRPLLQGIVLPVDGLGLEGDQVVQSGEQDGHVHTGHIHRVGTPPDLTLILVGQSDLHPEAGQIPGQAFGTVAVEVDAGGRIVAVHIRQGLLSEVTGELNVATDFTVGALHLVAVLLVTIGVDVAGLSRLHAVHIGGQLLLVGKDVAFLVGLHAIDIGHQLLVVGGHGDDTIAPIIELRLQIEVLGVSVHRVARLLLVNLAGVFPLQCLKGLIHAGLYQLEVIQNGLPGAVNGEIVLVHQLIAALAVVVPAAGVMDHTEAQRLGGLSLAKLKVQVRGSPVAQGIPCTILVVHLDVGVVRRVSGYGGKQGGAVGQIRQVSQSDLFTHSVHSHHRLSQLLLEDRSVNVEAVALGGGPVVEHIAPDHSGKGAGINAAQAGGVAVLIHAGTLVQQDLLKLRAGKRLIGVLNGTILIADGLTLFVHLRHLGRVAAEHVENIAHILKNVARRRTSGIQIVHPDVQPVPIGLHGQSHGVDPVNALLAVGHQSSPVTIDPNHSLHLAQRILGDGQFKDRGLDLHGDGIVVVGLHGDRISPAQSGPLHADTIDHNVLDHADGIVVRGGIRQPVPNHHDGVVLHHIGVGLPDGNDHPGVALLRQDHIPAAVGVLGYLVDGNDGVLVGSASLKANGLSVVSNIQIVVVDIELEGLARLHLTVLLVGEEALKQGVGGEVELAAIGSESLQSRQLHGGLHGSGLIAVGIGGRGGLGNGLIAQVHGDTVLAQPVDHHGVDPNVVGVTAISDGALIVEIHTGLVVAHVQDKPIAGPGHAGIGVEEHGLHALVDTAHQNGAARTLQSLDIHSELLHIVRHGDVVGGDRAVEHAGKGTLADAQVLQLRRTVVVGQPDDVEDGPHTGLGLVAKLVQTVGHHFHIVFVAHSQRDGQLPPAALHQLTVLVGSLAYVEAGDPQLRRVLSLGPDIEVVHLVGHDHIVVMDVGRKVVDQPQVGHGLTLVIHPAKELVDPQAGDLRHGRGYGMLVRGLGLFVAPVDDHSVVATDAGGIGESYLHGVVAHHQVPDGPGQPRGGIPAIDDQAVDAGLVGLHVIGIARLGNLGDDGYSVGIQSLVHIIHQPVTLGGVAGLSLLVLVDHRIAQVGKDLGLLGLVRQVHIVEVPLRIEDGSGLIGHTVHHTANLQCGALGKVGLLLHHVGAVPPDGDAVLLTGDLPVVGLHLHKEEEVGLSSGQTVHSVIPSVGHGIHSELGSGFTVHPGHTREGIHRVALDPDTCPLLLLGPQDGPEDEGVVGHVDILAAA